MSSRYGGEFVEESVESVVDKMLESSGSVLEAEGHDEVFKETVSCNKCCFPFFPGGQAEPVESTDNIEFRVVLGFVEGILGFT